MYTQAKKTSESNKKPANLRDGVSMKKNSGESALQFASNRTKAVSKNKDFINNDRIVQRIPTKVKITWGITHVVKKEKNSLFGGKYYKEGEIGARGELHAGQIITIDTEKAFTSRRGPNQEDTKIRAANESSKPSFVWYHVLSLGGEDVSAEKLYVRQGTFGQAPSVAIDRLSSADIELVQQIMSTSIQKGSEAQKEWLSLIAKVNIPTTDAFTSSLMIGKMYTLYVLGAMLKSNYSQFQLAHEQDVAPAQGMKLILPLVARLIRKATGLTVNGIETGGNYEDWTSLSMMSEYLQTAFKTFTSLFSEFGEGGKIDLLKTLRSSDSNIEKFINLMVSEQVRNMLAASGPQGKLEGELAGHSTASGGIGRGLVNVAGDYLANEFLLTKYTQNQIYTLDYEESAASFQKWLMSAGYTFEVIRNSIRNSARGSETEEPISTAEVKKLLLNYTKSQFPQTD